VAREGVDRLVLLDNLVSRIDSLGLRPDTLAVLLEVLEDPTADASRLVPVVESDPALLAGLLKLCNSSLYHRPRRIGTAREALVMTGNLTFARLCLALGLEGVLGRELPGYGLPSEDLWKHSLVTAHGAAAYATAMGLRGLRDRAFSAGLLHDIGKLVLDGELAQRRPAPAADVQQAEPGPTLEDERAVLGCDHAEAGAALLARWNLPEVIVAAVRWHHDPDLAGEHRPLAEAVNCAERIAHFAGELHPTAESIEAWVAGTFDAARVPTGTACRLVSSALTRRGNLLALAAAPVA
jgi:putative nucleotidyltransferase with HDIG domain